MRLKEVIQKIMTEERFFTLDGVKREVVKEMDFGEYKVIELKQDDDRGRYISLIFIDTMTDEYLVTTKMCTGLIVSEQVPSVNLLQLFRKFCCSIEIDIVFAYDHRICNEWTNLGFYYLGHKCFAIWADPGRSGTVSSLEDMWIMKGKHPLDDVPDVHQLADFGKRAKSSD